MQALILKVLAYVFTLPFLAGYRTYIVAAGLLGKAIYDVSQGEYPQAVTDFLGFLAAVGVRAAVASGQITPKAMVVLVALFLAASGGRADDVTYTETLVGEVGPPVVNYYTAEIQDLAKKEKRPLVLFRGGAKPRHIVRARCCYDFPNAKPDVLVAAVADPTQMSACLPGDATDDQIYEAVKKSLAGFVMSKKLSGQYDPYGYADYAKFRQHIEGGGRGVLYVGVEDKSVGTYAAHCRVPSGFKGLADGVYDCFFAEGTPRMTKRQPAATRHCTGEACSCGFYGGGSGSCGCPVNGPYGDCQAVQFRPPAVQQFQLQPLQLRMGMMSGGCANGSCSGGR